MEAKEAAVEQLYMEVAADILKSFYKDRRVETEAKVWALQRADKTFNTRRGGEYLRIFPSQK